MSRRVRLVLAAAAYLAALVLFFAALAIESPRVYFAAGVGVWVLAGVGVLLLWSVARPERVAEPVRAAMPHAVMSQRLREISREIDPEKRDAMWADLERDMAGGVR